MLLRIPGRPWDTIYNEDLTVYLFDALDKPWHLFIPYGGYVQLLPRLVGQLAAMLRRFEVPRAHRPAQTWAVVLAGWGHERARSPAGGVLHEPTWDLPKGVTEAIPWPVSRLLTH
jgi:hypothetical protein